jgi:hypothetical protein
VSVTALSQGDDEWWRQVFTETEHADIEARFDAVKTEHEKLTETVYEVTFHVTHDTVERWLGALHQFDLDGNVTPDVQAAMQMVGWALGETWMNDTDFVSSESCGEAYWNFHGGEPVDNDDDWFDDGD